MNYDAEWNCPMAKSLTKRFLFYLNSTSTLYRYICTLKLFNNRIIIFGSVFDKF